MSSVGVGIQFGLFIGAFAASFIGVAVFRKWSHRRELFDVPNERSSHTTPTPRGGGVAIVVVCLTLYLVIGQIFGLPFSWGYFLGALLVAAVSWLDDLYSLPFWSRLLVHIGAAVILINDLGFWSEFSVPLTAKSLSIGSTFGVLLTVGWVVWLLNAYNFMDGIDGIAGLQATVAGLGWTILALLLHLDATFMLSGILAASSAGFLVHNWQPAKIFMGDVGSAFLGFTLAAMPLIARADAGSDLTILPIAAVLFVWFFLFDTLFTLTKRLIARRRVWEAHREHIYQKLTIQGRSHAAVALMYNAAAAVVTILVLLSVILSGIYPALTFLSLLLVTASICYLGLKKKGIDLNN